MNSKNLKIFLIGYPGSGKSRFAKRIANYYYLPLLDTDEIISDEHKLSVAEIFEQYGEIYFRKCEKNVLNECIAKYDGFVMATGGGLPCHFNNMDTILNNSSAVFYLKTKPEILYGRLKVSKTARPNHPVDDELFTKIQKELEEREHFYTQAHYTIDSRTGAEHDIIYICNLIKVQ